MYSYTAWWLRVSSEAIPVLPAVTTNSRCEDAALVLFGVLQVIAINSCVLHGGGASLTTRFGWHADNPAAERIGLTIGGTLQIATQVMGMRALLKKDRDLKEHAYWMRQALLFACLVPALMRMPKLFGVSFGSAWEAYAFLFAFPIYFLSENAMRRGKWY